MIDTYAEYDARPGVRSGLLRALLSSALDARHYLDTGGGPDTASRRWLRAVHAAVLTPAFFPFEYAVYPGVPFKSGPKAGTDEMNTARTGAAYEDWLADHEGIEALTAAEMDGLQAVARRLREHPVSGPILADPAAEGERSLYWSDPETGLPCKARIDWYAPGIIYDLKAVRGLDDWAIRRQARDLGWYLQAAHYLAGAQACGLEATGAAWICYVEGPPCDVRVVPLDPADLAETETTRRSLLLRLARCYETDTWPGAYEDGPVGLNEE